MRNLVAVLLASFQISLAGAERECCFPPRYEGQKYYVERNVTVDFAVDFGASRIYETHDDTGENFHIIDLAGGTINLFNNGKCRTFQFDGSMHYRQCLDDDTRINLVSLWGIESPIEVDTHRIEAQNSIRTVFVTRRVHEVCIPFYVNKLVGRNRVAINAHFKRVSQSVTRYNADRLYSDLTNCQVLWN